MRKAILALAVLCGICFGTAAQNDSIPKKEIDHEINPYQITMMAVSLKIMTVIDVSPENFDKGWLRKCDTVVITDPDEIRRIVDGLIMGAERSKYRQIDTRGKLILQYHDGYEKVVYYDNLDMVIDDEYYYANTEIMKWLDELRESKHKKYNNADRQ